MVFKCQEDGFLKEFTSNVIECTESKFLTVIDKEKCLIHGYEVICADTILFPEGGGQPCDQGYLNDIRVYQVQRRGDQAVHYVSDPIEVGQTVNQVLDWDRRFDHMQQHSGQHLISGVLEKDFGIKTLSWWLGEDDSYIEIETPQLSKEQINQTEIIVNDLIRAATKVSVEVLKEDAPEEVLKELRSVKGLPEDHKGDIRVITIHGVESNMCCGTHVTNLSQLQAIKLLHVEKSKRKNQTLLHFIIGNRVLKRLDESLSREQKITTLLNNGPAEHVDLIGKLIKNTKVITKNNQILLKNLAISEAKKLKIASPQPKYYCYHCKEGDQDFVNNFLREIGNTATLLLLCSGDEKGIGNITLYGDENLILELGDKVCELLAGKGAGKGKRFQAKCSKMGNKSKVIELFKEYFKE